MNHKIACVKDRMHSVGINGHLERFRFTGDYAVAQLVKALRYKPEGRGFDSHWGHWNFSVT
jgi:hypothetical protein